MFLKNVWNVAAWSHELEEGAVLSRTILGERIVMFRQESGAISAFVDRCPHRAAPLSAGRREGDALRCMYHGLLFDGGGACIEVPGQDRVPPNLNVRAFPVVERHNYVWVWMGDPALADPGLLPDTHWQDDPRWHYVPGYLHYDASYLLIMDNLLDFSHLGFVHEQTLGGGRKSGEVRAGIERFDWGLRVTRKYSDKALPPFIANVAAFTGPIDRWQIYDWHIAGNVLIMDSGAAPAGTGAFDGHIAPEALTFRSIQSLTPESETTTHYFWMFAHTLERDIDAVSQELSRQTHRAFLEDKAMIEAQQAILRDHPDQPMAAIGADAALNQGRWLIDRMMKAEQAVSAAP